jgi:Subtilase family/Secretion system C-terminal sorting domain
MRYFFFILLLVVNSLIAGAQVQLQVASVDFFDKYGVHGNAVEGKFYIVQLSGKCSLPAGFQPVRTLDDGILIAMRNGQVSPAQPQSCISRISPANNLWKLSPQLEVDFKQTGLDSKKPVLFTVTTIDLRQFLNSSYFTGNQCKLVYISKESNSAVIECTLSVLQQQILNDGAVLFAGRYYIPETEVLLSGFDKSNNSMSQAGFLLSMVNGRGVTAGIKERKMDVNDMDLQNRVISSPIAAAETEPHATAIATMIGGAGNSFYTGRGIAPKCSFFSSSFLNLFPDSTNLLIQNKINIQNHSYGTINQQFYGAEATAYDVQTWANKNLLHTFSSGNRGAEAATTGTYSNLATFANLTGNYKNAKNVITTGALDTSGSIAPFSSSGPLYDGRLAPQIAAFGLNGTSDAAALVSGTAALLHQVYKDSNAQAVPPASLVKALLFNTADDVAAKGIDYRSGFGALNVYSAVAAMLQKKYDGAQVAHNQVWTKNIILPAQSANLRITLCWTDTASLVNNNRALVNDLDLELVEMATGTVYRPWVLSTAPNIDSLKKLPVRKRDALNTAEQVSIELPNAGSWQIRVAGTAVQTTAPQTFNIAWGWDTLNTFVFTNPLQAEDVSLEESPMLAVKWKTAVADANTTGSLFITYNNGISWQPIASNIRLAGQQYKWKVKDTASTARLRMDCPFGSFFSNNFIISPVTVIRLDFLCPDSTGITWKKHAYATTYQVFALASDTACMRPVLLTADTSVMLLRNVYNYDLFTVQPVLSNGLQAVRSPAIDTRSQGVNCFYTSLQALNNSGKIDLLLELSSTATVDSVIFEKLGAGNSVMRIQGRLQVITGQLSYVTVDNEPAAGTNTYRVRIRYKNGKSSYTETVTVLTTGNKYLLIYPNPVSSGSLLNYQLKDIAADWQLQLIDVQGRIVLSQPVTIAGKLKISGTQAGIYFYRLTDKKTGISEKGKIIITN